MRSTLACAVTFISFLSGMAGAQSARSGDEIVFIHLNDLHAHLVPHHDLVRELDASGSPTASMEMRGGLARSASAINEIRRNSANSVLMNIGDTYHGGVEALYTRGNAIVPPVDAPDIDIGVPGNWDFAYGPITTRLRYDPEHSALSKLVNRILFGEQVTVPGYPLLGGNVTKSLPLLDSDEPLLPATTVLTVGDHRVGFIGITSDIIPRMSPMLAMGFEFLEGEAAYRDYINQHASSLRQQGTEIIVVMSELGIHKDWQLANVVAPGVDVFFSAHTHELTTEPLLSKSGAVVVEAGNDGVLGIMTVGLGVNGAKQLNWKLVDIGPEIPADPRVTALVEEARAPFLAGDVDLEFPMPGANMPLHESIDTVIGTAPTVLHRRNALENPFNRFLSENLRAYYGTDIAITPGFRFDAVIAEGDTLTVEDSYHYLPVPPLLARGTIRGQALRELIEFELGRTFSKDAFDHSGGWLMGLSGVKLTLDLGADEGRRVIAMKRADDGTAIAAEDRLSVVSCLRSFDPSDALCGNRGFEDIEELESPSGSAWTAREFLQWLIGQERSAVPAGDGSIIDVSGKTVWPEAPFIQPLWETNQ